LRGAATLLFCVFASGAGAQVSGTASVASDYRYRGITLSDRKPAAQLGVTIDDPVGWYAGVFGSTVRLAPPVGSSVQAMAFAGLASRLSSGISVEVGGDYSAFTGARGYGYGEAYLGLAIENVSARIYYSPRYFGQQANAVYGEINGAHSLIDRVRIFAHMGYLASRSDSIYGSRSDQRVWDGRIGLGFDFDLFQVELAWVGISASGVAYRITGGRSPNAVVLTLSRPF
jgi:uncharacterized protein (TIGR02001 family)